MKQAYSGRHAKAVLVCLVSYTVASIGVVECEAGGPAGRQLQQTVTRRKPKLARIPITVLGSEGPVFTRDGRFFMVSPPKHTIVTVDLKRGVASEFANTNGIPAGLQVDRHGNLWCADMRRGILRISPSGQVFPEVTHYQGQPIRGCNDLYLDSTGNLYFTAPAGSNRNRPVGEVFVRLTDGQVHRLDRGLRFPNGLAVTADDRTLIVAETPAKTLWAYDVSTPGQATGKRVFAKMLGPGNGPDGMDFDCEGYLLVAFHGGGTIDVFDRNGQLTVRLEMPFKMPSNVHFAPGSVTVYVTEHSNNGLWSFQWVRPGQKQYGER